MKAGDGIKMANNVFQFPCEKCNFEKRECAEVAHTAQCPGLCIFTEIYTHFPNPNPIKKQYWMARRMYAYSKHIISQYEWAAHTHSTMITSHNTLNDTDLPFHAVYSTGSILFYFISLLRFKFNSFFHSLSLSLPILEYDCWCCCFHLCHHHHHDKALKNLIKVQIAWAAQRLQLMFKRTKLNSKLIDSMMALHRYFS